MNFEKMVSNQTTVHTLKKAAQSGKLSHAYLLHGTVGTGKKTLAHIFSEAILCRGLAEKPCGECLPCKKAEKEIHPDIMIVRKPEGKSGILVEQVRQLRQDVYTRPNESDYRIVIIEESETMNLSAANALLKVLEEPPPYLVFILTANNISA
ncbi:MAG: AAA family ATPase [Oscillospiraceae bacterium]